jgi:hypothetical protein
MKDDFVSDDEAGNTNPAEQLHFKPEGDVLLGGQGAPRQVTEDALIVEQVHDQTGLEIDFYSDPGASFVLAHGGGFDQTQKDFLAAVLMPDPS